MNNTVIELFAGVGGFRVGLNSVCLKDNKVTESNDWQFVWANQWEPSTKIQPAFDCYTQRFGESETHVNKDISNIDVKDIPEHTLLVGGFPCQDYSVARTLSKGYGIQGKKGVLWWEIYRIIKHHKTPFLLLENVDRLLKSPASQRGRDFGIMLKSLSDLGYGVQWRVINAADYGNVQRRRRVFIFAYHKTTSYYKTIKKLDDSIYSTGLFAQVFPIENHPNKNRLNKFTLSDEDLVEYTSNFNQTFYSSGILHKKKVVTLESIAIKKDMVTLGEILERNVNDEYLLTKKQVEKHEYLKGSKRILREKPNGEPYYYSEGAMSFPDDLNKPGRTMLTSEGTINRSSHVVRDLDTGNIRKITPIEAERLNSFPDNWTNTGMNDRQRYFMMGNALVTKLVKDISPFLKEIIN